MTENGIHLQPCPHCSKKFSRKAYDRHLEYCEERKSKAERRLGLSGSKHTRRGRDGNVARRSSLSTTISFQQHSDRHQEMPRASYDEDRFTDFYSEQDAAYEAAVLEMVRREQQQQQQQQQHQYHEGLEMYQ